MAEGRQQVSNERKQAYITLSQGFFAVVDAEDVPRLGSFSWFIYRPSASDRLIYAVRKVRTGVGRYTKRLMHRDVLVMSDNFEVDHKNGNGLDNRKENLRPATASQNQANARQHVDAGYSQYKGVTFHKITRRWQASVQCNKKRRFFGGFKTEKEAAEAYNKEAAKVFGEYARLNEIV